MNKKVGGIIGRIYPGSRITYIKRFSKGLIHQTYEVMVDNKLLVLRISEKDFWKIKKEKYIYNLISKKTDVPVPRILKTGRDYTLMSKLEGKELSVKDKKSVEKAGEYLAKIHSIKFPYYGWIIGNKIKPKFRHWIDFINYDINLKFKKIPEEHQYLKKKVKKIVDENMPLLDIDSKPSLLHKDYHFSHIIVNKGKIEGIIDLEWAMSGHNEMDIAKSCLWMFENKPQMERIFLQGYRKYGKLSREFPERKRLYKLLVILSALSFSYECKHRRWCAYNLKELKGELNEYNKDN